MNAGIVTVSLSEGFALRSEDAGLARVFTLSSFSVLDEDNIEVARHFKDEMGNEGDLEILGFKQFNKRNPNDRHNIEMLKLFLKTNKEFAKKIVFNDTEELAQQELAAADKTFEILSYLRQNRENSGLLAKLYRRVFGTANGITETILFTELDKRAKERPDDFVVHGDFIYNDRDFETHALIDACVDKGLLTRGIGDEDNLIRHKDGQILADSMEKAVFYLNGDEKTRLTLQRLVDDRSDKPLRQEYVPQIESSPLVILNESTSLKTDVKAHSKTDKEYEEEILNNISFLVSKGFVVKSGAGAITRYHLSALPDNKFKKVELVGFFMKNKSQYEDLKNRADL